MLLTDEAVISSHTCAWTDEHEHSLLLLFPSDRAFNNTICFHMFEKHLVHKLAYRARSHCGRITVSTTASKTSSSSTTGSSLAHHFVVLISGP